VLNVLARLLLTSTALAPVGLTYAWVGYIQQARLTAAMIFALSILLFLSCLILIQQAKKSLPASDFQASDVEAADHENTAFLLLYLMPLFTAQFGALDWQLWIPTIAIFAVITATGYNYHFNPMLGLIGWHFYKVKSPDGVTFILITKKHLRTAATKLRIGQLTEYMLLDLGGK
jgi:hypothetical protein